MTTNTPVKSPFYTVVAEDGGNGQPIAFETFLSDGCSREKAEVERRKIDAGCGRSWIAECHILPDSQIEPIPVTTDEAIAAIEVLALNRSRYQGIRALQVIRRFAREWEERDV